MDWAEVTGLECQTEASCVLIKVSLVRAWKMV